MYDNLNWDVQIASKINKESRTSHRRTFMCKHIRDKMNGLTCIYGNKHLQGIHVTALIAYGYDPVFIQSGKYWPQVP